MERYRHTRPKVSKKQQQYKKISADMSADIFFGNDIAVDPAAPVILSKAKTFC